MKVVQINITYGDSDSTGRNVKELHKYLLERGIDSNVYVTSINDESEVDAHIHLFSSSMDKMTHAFLSRFTGKQGYYSRYTTKKLISELKNLNPDVVMLHVLHGNCINFPLLFRYFATDEIAVVLVLHDCWYYTGHCCHYTSAGCDKWKKTCGKCPQLHQWNKSWFFDFSKQALRDKKLWFSSVKRIGVIGVSDWITNEAQQSILKNARLIKRIYNWIDVSTFRPRNSVALRKKLKIQSNKRVILGVASNWGNQKGLKEMILAAENIPNVIVVLIGTVPENVIMPENIRCIGKIAEPSVLAEYYSLADVFLNPSIQETFGKTTAESLCCGTPVIVYNTTACTELIGENCGKVVPAFDRKLYIQKTIQQLAENNESTERYCQDFAIRNFSADKCMEEYIDVLKNLQKTR